MPIDPTEPKRTLVLRLSPLRKTRALAVVVPDWVESTPEPYVRPAHMVPPSGPSLYLAPEATLAG